MDVLMFLAVYFAGFITAIKIFLALIFWKEIKQWLQEARYAIKLRWEDLFRKDR